MKHFYFILTLFFLLIFDSGCDSDNSKTIIQKNDSVSVSKAEKKYNSSNHVDCSNTVRDFIIWYRKNFKELKSIQLVDLIEDSTTAQYRVNFKNAEIYIDKIDRSGLFSKRFLENNLKYFKEKDEELVKEKQNDGPPIGFEADLFLFTQEPESVFRNINSLKIESLSPDEYKLFSLDNNLIFSVTTDGNKCLIDEIKFSKK